MKPILHDALGLRFGNIQRSKTREKHNWHASLLNA